MDKRVREHNHCLNLVNGSPTDEFPLQRGLRQGDPLFPFLFLLADEGLNVLMNSVVENNLYKGYGVGTSNSEVVSHLQFADDTLLIGEKIWANVQALRGSVDFVCRHVWS